MFYEVKWKGYDESQNTWEPAHHLSRAQDILKEFEESHIKKSKRNVKKNISKKQISTKKKQKIPDFEEEQEDFPENVISCITPKEKDSDKRMFRLSWEKRDDGTVPRNSILSGQEIKDKFGKDLLFEFYEKNFKG